MGTLALGRCERKNELSKGTISKPDGDSLRTWRAAAQTDF